MSEAKAKLLRNRAAALRSQAATGELVAVAVREVLQDVPREMHALISEQLHDGTLLRVFTEEHQRGRQQQVADGEAIPAALSGVLMKFTREVQKLITARLSALDAARLRSLGRAEGLDEALAELAPKVPPSPTEEPAAESGLEHA